MQTNFTDPARRAMLGALREAERFGQPYLGTEHILLGLLGEGEGVAAAVLRSFGIDEQRARAEVERIVTAVVGEGPVDSFSQTPRAHKAIDYAIEEARALGHNALGTGHLLLGLLREPDAFAAQVLILLGVPLAYMGRAILERIEKGPEGTAKEAGPGPEGAPEPGAIDGRAFEAAFLYEGFTGQARRVVLLAHREAHRFGHDYVGTEHLLLGVLQEGSGRVAALLQAFGVATETVRRELEKVVRQGPEVPVGARLPLTPPARRALKFAREESRRLHHDHVGPEHVLLGLLHEPEGQAAQVLAGLGLDLARLRAQTLGLPSPEDRDAMLQPAAASGLLAADPSAEELGWLVAAHVPATPAGGQVRKQTAAGTAGAVPGADGLALQLRITQLVLAGLAGVVTGTILHGPAGAFLGLLAGTLVALARSTALGVVAGILAGVLVATHQAPRNPGLQVLAIFAGAIVGCCFGDFLKGFARERPPDDGGSPGSAG